MDTFVKKIYGTYDDEDHSALVMEKKTKSKHSLASATLFLYALV